MNTLPTHVTDKDGNKKPALLVVCPDCGSEAFVIFVIDGHNHLQCFDCEHSFCQAGEQCSVNQANVFAHD